MRFVVEWLVQGGAVLAHVAERPYDDKNTLVISDVFWLPLCECADRHARIRGGDSPSFLNDHLEANVRPFGPWSYATEDFTPFSEMAMADLPAVDTARLKMAEGGMPPRLADVAKALVEFVDRAPTDTIWLRPLECAG